MGGGPSATAQNQINQNRDYTFGTGGALADRTQNLGDAYGTLASQRRQIADTAYSPILAGQGGYSPSQAASIQDPQGLNALKTSGTELQGNFLNDTEQQQIRGNPNAGQTSDADLQSNYLTPDEESGITGDQSGINSGLSDIKQNVNDYASQIRMTPEQQQQMVTSAARSQAGVDQSAAQANVERARSAGLDPLGVASYSGRANQQSQINQANAASAARVAADQERVAREGQIEGVAQGANTQNLGAQQQMESNASTRAAGLAQNRQQTGEANQGTKYAQGQTADKTASDRATTLATNRQATNVGNQNTQFTQGQYVEGQGAQRAQTVADAQRTDQAEARKYYGDDANSAQNAALTEEGLNSGIFATTGSLANGSTNTQVQGDSRPPWWQSVLSAGAQVGAAAAGKASDRRLKENIEPLEAIQGVKFYRYNFIGKDSSEIGVIAQELHQIHPEFVLVGGEDPQVNPWRVLYADLLAKLDQSFVN